MLSKHMHIMQHGTRSLHRPLSLSKLPQTLPRPSGGVLTIHAVAYRRNNTTPMRQRVPSVPSAPPADQNSMPTSAAAPRVEPDGIQSDDVPSPTGLAASTGMILGLVLVLGGVYMGREQIHEFVDFFITVVESYGMWGYLAYAVVYCLLELLAVPAIPLTMTAGAIFGVIPGTCVVSISATIAAAGAFLIARYVARDKVQRIAQRNPRWAAIDRAIGKDSFRVVTLLRLSPLLPLAVSNYLYGLTSVELMPYVLGSWLGMLPGTCAYVAAGAYGADALAGTDGAFGGVPQWQVLLAIGATLGAVSYIGILAKKALAEAGDLEE